MTQAFNLSQLANNLNSAGQLDVSDGIVNAVPIANGGTGASTDASARANLNVPTRTGGDASGTWAISISGNASTATSATTAANGGVTSVNGSTGAVVVTTTPTSAQILNGYAAGAATDVVGTYIFAGYRGGTASISENANIAGSNLVKLFSGSPYALFPSLPSGNLSGTWKLMQTSLNGYNFFVDPETGNTVFQVYIGFFIRIS